MKPFSVLLSAAVRRRLARISRKTGLSPATVIRYAVKKQLPLWEGGGSSSNLIADKIRKPKTAAPRARIK